MSDLERRYEELVSDLGLLFSLNHIEEARERVVAEYSKLAERRANRQQHLKKLTRLSQELPGGYK